MGWFSNLFGRPKAAPATPAATTERVDLIPGRLVGRVVSHEVAAGPNRYPCWTYFTEGMAAVGQDELLFTLRRWPDEPAAPPHPLMLMSQVFTFAERGQTVGPWDYTVFSSPRGFLGVTTQVGVVYVRPTVELPEVPLTKSPQALLMTLLRTDEALVVREIGAYRVLTLLGRANRFYPYPHWSDRDRPAVLNPADAETSVTMRVGSHIFWRAASVRVAVGAVSQADASGDRSAGELGEVIELTVARDTAARLAGVFRRLGDEGAFVLRTAPDETADARMVWRPGQMGPETITPNGGTAAFMTGGFLTVAFGTAVEDGGRLIEDGFAMVFQSGSWQAFLRALEQGTAWGLPARAAGMQAFSLRFR